MSNSPSTAQFVIFAWSKLICVRLCAERWSSSSVWGRVWKLQTRQYLSKYQEWQQGFVIRLDPLVLMIPTQRPRRSDLWPPRCSVSSVCQRCLQFDLDCTTWNAKQQIICSLNESLWDVYNYGLFQPAGEGRDAKFLEEEQPLRNYSQSFEKGVPYLEVNG